MNVPPAKRISEQDKKILALWAAECAEHVLPFFETVHPGDDRPRKAIEAARAWERGELPMMKARAAAVAAHAAAREAVNPAAVFAARAAGHAAATAHSAGHATAAASYARKAAAAGAAAMEREWQEARAPQHLRHEAFRVDAYTLKID